jgi:DNA-binding LytR/AlgR family response regulator
MKNLKKRRMHDTTFLRHFGQCEVQSLIRIGACDDEARERKTIVTLIEKWVQAHLTPVDIRCYDNGEKLLAAIEGGDIRFAESSARVVTVHARESGNSCYYDKLDNFGLLCDDERFVRCHNSFLLNLDYVQAIVATGITLDSGEEITIGKNAHEIKARFASYVAQRI